MMKYYCDQNPNISLDIVDLPFPLPNDVIVDRAEEAISHWNELARPNYTGQAQPTGKTPEQRVRLVVVDSIVSNPGSVYLLACCSKELVALTCYQGSHALGTSRQCLQEVRRV
jgi:hypothetical protein